MKQTPAGDSRPLGRLDTPEVGAVRIVGIPMDLGQDQRGVDMGPSAVRYAGLARRLRRLGYRVEDAGNLHVPARVSLTDDDLVPTLVRTCEAAYEQARAAIGAGQIPLLLGGDHSIAVGTVGGVTHERPCGVLWIDAHGDFNTIASSPSGNVHGMALALLLGRGDARLVDVGRSGASLDPSQVVVLGLRQLDSREREALKSSGMRLLTMRDIDERGIGTVAREALARFSHLPALHVSLDMDGLDPREAPGVGTPVQGGLTYREAQVLMEIIADTGKLGSLDVVEVNPMLDQGNRTADIAVELIASALGKSIL